MQEHGGLRKDVINKLNIGSNYEKFGRNLGWVIKKYMYEDSDENEIYDEETKSYIIVNRLGSNSLMITITLTG